MRLILLAFLASAFAVSARAQPAPTVPQPTPEEVAAARAEGDALLKAANAENLFDNESAGGAIILRHRASGFRCVLNPGKARNQVTVGRTLTRGDDVGCYSQTVTDARDLFFTRAPEKTPELALAEEVKITRLGDPGATVYTPAPSAPLPGLPFGVRLPAPVTASLKGGHQGGHRIVVGRVGEWLVIYRFQGAPQVGDMGDILDHFWTTTVLEARRHAATAGAAEPASSFQAKPTELTPEQAHSQSAAILDRARATDVFEILDEGKLPTLRHKPSGMVCVFEPGAPDNEVEIYPRQPRGSDVRCTTRTADAISSFYVVKFPMNLSVEQARGVFLTEIKQAHPDMSPLSGTFADATSQRKDGSAQPRHLTARLTYIDNGQRIFSRLSVAVVNGWIVEQRTNAPLSSASVADLAAEIIMLGTIDRLSQSATTPAPTPQPASPV